MSDLRDLLSYEGDLRIWILSHNDGRHGQGIYGIYGSRDLAEAEMDSAAAYYSKIYGGSLSLQWANLDISPHTLVLEQSQNPLVDREETE